MRRGTYFWAIVLILIGGLLLLDNLGVLRGVSVWSLLWPLALVAFGVWMLVRSPWVVAGRNPAEIEQVSIPLEGATQARLRIRHGAGSLRVDASASPTDLVTGSFGGGLDRQVQRTGDTLDVELSVPEHVARHGTSWMWGRDALAWTLGLQSAVPLSLDFETGANAATLDLAALRVTELRLRTGASSTSLTLPASAGFTHASIGSGAASMRIQVPAGVAARIRVSAGLSGVSVDRQRFPRTGDVYQSADYDTAANKVDLDIETGVGSLEVR